MELPSTPMQQSQQELFQQLQMASSQPQPSSQQYPPSSQGQQQHYNHQSQQITVVVDRARFVQTKNALTNAFVGLSGAIDEAVKAYVNHTNAVLDGMGGHMLDVGGLLEPFNALANANSVAQMAQQALQNGNGFPVVAQTNTDGTRKKRQYKPRDPNAPKRPLTAYFRYLQEQRPIISAELQNAGPNESGKAGDISKIATERWNALEEKDRKPYRAAYEAELGAYNDAVKAYKGTNGGIGEEDAVAEEEEPRPKAEIDDTEDDDDDDDDDDEESSNESSSESDDDDSSEDEIPARPPQPPAPKSKSPEVSRKMPKSAVKKTITAGADPVAPVAQFSSLNPPAYPIPAPANQAPKKRKGEDVGDVLEKKRNKKSKAERQAEHQAQAASQLMVIDPQLQHTNETAAPTAHMVEKPKKEKKKKRKSENGTA